MFSELCIGRLGAVLDVVGDVEHLPRAASGDRRDVVLDPLVDRHPVELLPARREEVVVRRVARGGDVRVDLLPDPLDVVVICVNVYGLPKKLPTSSVPFVSRLHEVVERETELLRELLDRDVVRVDQLAAVLVDLPIGEVAAASPAAAADPVGAFVAPAPRTPPAAVGRRPSDRRGPHRRRRSGSRRATVPRPDGRTRRAAKRPRARTLPRRAAAVSSCDLPRRRSSRPPLQRRSPAVCVPSLPLPEVVFDLARRCCRFSPLRASRNGQASTAEQRHEHQIAGQHDAGVTEVQCVVEVALRKPHLGQEERRGQEARRGQARAGRGRAARAARARSGTAGRAPSRRRRTRRCTRPRSAAALARRRPARECDPQRDQSTSTCSAPNSDTECVVPDDVLRPVGRDDPRLREGRQERGAEALDLQRAGCLPADAVPEASGRDDRERQRDGEQHRRPGERSPRRGRARIDHDERERHEHERPHLRRNAAPRSAQPARCRPRTSSASDAVARRVGQRSKRDRISEPTSSGAERRRRSAAAGRTERRPRRAATPQSAISQANAAA